MTEMNELVHPYIETAGGAKVVLLNTGAIITAEDEAMLQALYSRDPASVFKHLETLAKVGSGKFMDQYYVGYGHKSIGDCGTITLFIEGVSMLVAKAIQDWMLYSGQECSTRYLDFSNQPFIDPINTDKSSELLQKWRSLYLKALPAIHAHLISQFPIQEGEKEKVYEKAINARSFDIARSLLPAGAATNLSWHANLRQTADKLIYLRHHPLKEVQEVAQAIEELLMGVFPNSFSGKRYAETENYVDWWMKEKYYLTPKNGSSDFRCTFMGIDFGRLSAYTTVLNKRPEKTEVPKQIGECGVVRYEAPLDFGSFRDLQRQRAVIQRMPLVTTDFGFEKWYLEAMPPSIVPKVQNGLDILRNESPYWKLNYGKENFQYLIPMGYRVPCSITGDLCALTYLVELRATTLVHPTMQRLAHNIGRSLQNTFGDFGLKLFVDWDALGRFDVRRGHQDITVKEPVTA